MTARIIKIVSEVQKLHTVLDETWPMQRVMAPGRLRDWKVVRNFSHKM